MCAAGLNYIRKTLRARAAEVRAGQLQVYHDSRLAGADVVDGYLRPMQVSPHVCVDNVFALKPALVFQCLTR